MEPIDYERVLADLEARRATFNSAVDGAIQSIRTIISLTAAVPGAAPSAHLSSRDAGSYLGLSLIDAAKKYLADVRKPQTNPQIAEGIEKGGFVHSSKNFTNTVGTALWRAEESGDKEIFRSGRLWYLKEWAPNYRKAVSLNPKDAIPDDVDGIEALEELIKGSD